MTAAPLLDHRFAYEATPNNHVTTVGRIAEVNRCVNTMPDKNAEKVTVQGVACAWREHPGR
jgi:hypothetical protein